MSDTSLYLISPTAIRLADFLPKLQQALEVGATSSFQLRLKNADDQEIIEAAREIIPLCRTYDVAFILNDRPDLTAICGADGVHLGQEDMPVAEARKRIGPERIIGVSCHASKHMAMEAAEQGADYVAFGAFYPTTSKPQEKVEKWGVPEPELLKWWSVNTTVPSVAIGGITPKNCAPLVGAGADFIAAITAVWDHPKGPAHAVAEFAAALGK